MAFYLCSRVASLKESKTLSAMRHNSKSWVKAHYDNFHPWSLTEDWIKTWKQSKKLIKERTWTASPTEEKQVKKKKVKEIQWGSWCKLLEVVEAVVVRHKEHQSGRLNRALVSLCQTSSHCRQKQYYRAVGLAKKNNSSCVLGPLEDPNSWEIGGLPVAQLNGT